VIPERIIFVSRGITVFYRGSVERLVTGWTVRGSNRGLGDIFCTRPERPGGPTSLLHTGYLVSFPGVKRPGGGVNHPHASRAEVKVRPRTGHEGQEGGRGIAVLFP
jgi:hypothetical protein